MIECVPNFSEGRNLESLHLIETAIRRIEGIHFLGCDRSASANRTVMTFAGPPQAVGEAAFRAIETASQTIDMRHHKGAHPRLGATDVCPLIPLAGASRGTAQALALSLGERLGRCLGIPVYLYEKSARIPERRNLAQIRRGGYEGLPARLSDPFWRPDFGPASLHERAGATVLGVREMLVAYNINLAGRATKAARTIAGRIRESGYKTAWGRVPGRFLGLKAIGWYMEEFRCAQVSMNITRIETAPLLDIYRTVAALAAEFGAAVTGSEVVGLLPQQVLWKAGYEVLGQPDPPPAEEKILETAIAHLGLRQLKSFECHHHILEKALAIAPLFDAPAVEHPQMLRD